MSSWQKAIKYAATAFAILLIVSIIGGIMSAVSAVDLFFGDNDISAETETYIIESKIDELSVTISAAEFEIISGNEFKVVSNHKYLTVDENNGKLSLSEKKRFFGLTSNKTKIQLYIPENTVFRKADIETGAGKVTVNSLSADTFKLDLGAGTVEIENLETTSNADINGGAGNIKINSGNINSLNLDMGVGKLELTSRLTGESSLDLGVGSADLVLIGSQEDYQIEIDKGIGDVTLDGEKLSDNSIRGYGINEIEIDGGVGEINIRLKEES